MQVTNNLIVKILDWFSDQKEFNWDEHIFQEHPKQFLIDWARRLKYFRFVKADGGHGSSPDKILLSLKYNGQDDLIKLFENLGINYQQYKKRPIKPELSLIPKTEWIEQPKHQVFNNINLFVWGYEENIEFSITGSSENKWKITVAEFENAESLETLFENYVQRLIDPPQDTKHCLCPKHYPQYWPAG